MLPAYFGIAMVAGTERLRWAMALPFLEVVPRVALIAWAAAVAGCLVDVAGGIRAAG